MADNLTDYAERKSLDNVLGTTQFTKPTVYVAAFTSATDDTGAGTEVTGGSYARQPLSASAAATVSGNTTASNNADIVFPVATADWGTIGWIALFDAASGGNMLLQAPVSVAKTIQSGDQLKITSGNLTFAIS